MFTSNYIPAVAYKSLLLQGMQNPVVGQNLNIGLYEGRINVFCPFSDKVCNNCTKGF